MNPLPSATAPTSPAGARGIDPLLTAARVLLFVLLAGVILAAVAAGAGLLGYIAAHGIPWRIAPWAPAWRPIADLLFALGALWIVADIVLALLAMIAAVARGAAFERANVARLEKIAWNTIGLAILGLLAKLYGSGIEGTVNGFEIGVDLPSSIGFALLLFILARVFRQGAAMRDELEATI